MAATSTPHVQTAVFSSKILKIGQEGNRGPTLAGHVEASCTVQAASKAPFPIETRSGRLTEVKELQDLKELGPISWSDDFPSKMTSFKASHLQKAPYSMLFTEAGMEMLTKELQLRKLKALMTLRELGSDTLDKDSQPTKTSRIAKEKKKKEKEKYISINYILIFLLFPEANGFMTS